MRVLIIEDEVSVSSFIKKGLEETGFQVYAAYDGSTGLSMALQTEVDVILLDVVLPGINGVELCKKLRSEHKISTPILMLTALGSTEDIVKGLESGADDYLTKPMKFRELSARIKALMRRKTSVDNNKWHIDDLEVNQDSMQVKRANKEINLTAKEFNLLKYFLMNKDKVVSRVDILENVWDVNFDLGTNVVDVYVNYLRNKIDKGFEQKLIHTVVGMGYILKDQSN